MRIELVNDLAEVQRLQAGVEDYCRDLEVSDKTIHRITLALEELVTNTITYGYAGGDRHRIDIAVSRRENRLAIEIVDDAQPFDPRERVRHSMEGGLHERPVGGLGLHLIGNLSDGVDYRRDEQRNHTTLYFFI